MDDVSAASRGHGWLFVAGILLASACQVAADHDCFWDDPTLSATSPCKLPLTADPECRIAYGSTTDAWQRLDCDVMVFSMNASKPSNKYVVIHAGDCDTYTEIIGDYTMKKAGSRRDFNYFGLRACAGLLESPCLYKQDNSNCGVIHMSWVPKLWGLLGADGFQGFNPPQLVDAWRHDSNARFLLLHEYGDEAVPYTYTWQHQHCNHTHPTPVCIGSDTLEPRFHDKWRRLKPLLHSSLNAVMQEGGATSCRVDIVDARNSSDVPGEGLPAPGGELAKNIFPDKPCTGMFAETGTTGWAWEMSGRVTSALKLAIMKAEVKGGRESKALKDFRRAMAIALEN